MPIDTTAKGPKATVAAIVAQPGYPGRILLMRRAGPPYEGDWCLPGGHIEPDEAAAEAVAREVREETGLILEPHFFSHFDELRPGCEHAVVLTFEGIGTGTLTRQEDEASELRWFSLEGARALPLAFTHNEILDRYAAGTSTVSDALRSELVAEYAALRNELLQQLGRRYQLLIFTVSASAAFIVAGTKEAIIPIVLLLYPIFAMFLMQAWTHTDVRVGQLGEYIRARIEPKLRGMGWETHLRDEYGRSDNSSFKDLVQSYVVGVFVTTEILTVLLATYLQIEALPDARKWIPFSLLFVVDGVAFYRTLSLARVRRDRYTRSA